MGNLPNWFYRESKRLVSGQPPDLDLKSEAKEFLNIKYSWAWIDAQNQPGYWQWIDKYPQDFGWSKKGDVDQLSVSVASHPIFNIGISFSNGEQPECERFKLTKHIGEGLCFSEQWSYSAQNDHAKDSKLEFT